MKENIADRIVDARGRQVAAVDLRKFDGDTAELPGFQVGEEWQ